MGKIREMSTAKAWEMHDALQSQAQVRFIQYVMKEEDVAWETAAAICTGRTDPKEPEYTLGYKLADPMGMMAMNMQLGKKARAQAVENFEATLDEDELKLFREQVATQSTRQMFRSALKREKKKKDP